MPNATSALTQVLRSRIGWSRIGVGIGVLIIAAAAVTLYRLLGNVDFDKVVAALEATPLRTVVSAGIFVVTGYVSLTFYDFFSLRTIGRHEVPYRVAALASFTSYSIGHNLGATVLTAGAVRFRIYSAWGVTVTEVAKIAFVTGLTFWLGNLFVLGAGMVYAPDAASAVNHLPAWLSRTIGLAALVAIAGYMIWLLPCPRIVGRDDWQVRLPGASLMLVQIGIGILDLGSGALALYMLLPPDPAIDFVTLLVTFVFATLLGFLSHAPGSLGVLDAALLVAMPQFETEQLLASLLAFRVLYFMLPLFLAALALAIREVRIASKAKAADLPDG